VKQIKKSILSVLFLLVLVGLKAQDFSPETYWQDVDFNDTALVSSSQFSKKMVDFLYQYSCCDEKSFDSLSIAGVGAILGKAKVNMRVYEYSIDFLLNGYNAMGKSQIVDYLLTYPMLFEGEISVAEGLRLDSITEPYQKVKVGEKAPDFSGITIDGKPYHLYDSEAKNIIVFFWSADCEYCHDFLTDIRKKLDLKSDYELVTFALADDVDEVQATVKKMRLSGYHFYDEQRWESKPFLDYHITSVPTVFLLDQEKTIVCKPYDWYELKLYINRNK
jgi:peroxiredoxin